MPDVTAVLEKLKNRFGERMWQYKNVPGDRGHRLVVQQEHLYPCLEFLKTACGCDMLIDVTCVDYLHYRGATDRFGLTYLLLDTATSLRLIVRCFLNEPHLTVPSAYPLWKGADWMEREVFDMFGITFDGHPDLRRILLPDEFVDFPLRKDYPLRGRGERHNFERITREES